jgi:hypothetical protein
MREPIRQNVDAWGLQAIPVLYAGLCSVDAARRPRWTSGPGIDPPEGVAVCELEERPMGMRVGSVWASSLLSSAPLRILGSPAGLSLVDDRRGLGIVLPKMASPPPPFPVRSRRGQHFSLA